MKFMHMVIHAHGLARRCQGHALRGSHGSSTGSNGKHLDLYHPLPAPTAERASTRAMPGCDQAYAKSGTSMRLVIRQLMLVEP
jgi:hypothetical protein